MEENDVEYFEILDKENNSLDNPGSRIRDQQMIWSESDVNTAEVCTSINSLPEEILENIFSFLSVTQRIQIERVCKRWQLVGKCWHSPSKLIIDDHRPNKNSETKDVTMKGCLYYSLSDNADGVISSILSRCGACLKELTLGCWNVGKPWVSRTSLQTIANHCPNLMEIRLHAVPLIDSFKELVEGCAHVKTVKLHGYASLRDKDLLVIVEGWKNLHCLDVFASLNFLDGACFDKISESLLVLRLSSCSNLQPLALETIAKRCHSIEELELACCDKVNPTILTQVLSVCKGTLKSLNLAYYEDDITTCKGIFVLDKLQELVINHCRAVNDQFCYTVSCSCPSLKKLNISSTSISDKGLRYLCSSVNLLELDVSSTTISGDGIETLASVGRLQVLVAQFCKSIRRESRCFLSVIQFCPNLRLLDLSYSSYASCNLFNVCYAAVQRGLLKNTVTIKVNNRVSEDIDLHEGKLRIRSSSAQDANYHYFWRN